MPERFVQIVKSIFININILKGGMNMTLSNVKVVVNDNRAMIIIDNPTENDLAAINEAFAPMNAIKKLAGIVAPEEPEPEIPKEPVQPPVQKVEPAQKTSAAPNKLDEMKSFLGDVQAQQVMGIEKTLWKMGTFLFPDGDRESFKKWFDTSSKEEHVLRYNNFKEMIMAK